VAVLHSSSEKTKRSRVKLQLVSACARVCFRYLNF
jgi:hypothetical protein